LLGELPLSLEASVRDLEAVVDRQALEPVALMGVFHSGPASVSYAARNPERVSHLLPWCTYSTGADYWRAAQSEGPFVPFTGTGSLRSGRIGGNCRWAPLHRVGEGCEGAAARWPRE
jgi:pimeloyl-ACP methyl ester carboxylesterase